MSRICLFHLSGNVFPSLPQEHPTLRIWTELAKCADEYHVFASAGRLHFSNSCMGNIHLHLLPGIGVRMWSYFFSSWWVLLAALRLRPTHIVAQCPVYGGLVGALCARMLRIPLFVEIHGAHYFRPTRPGLIGMAEHWLYRKLSRIAFRASTRVRSLSDDMTHSVREVYGASTAAKVIVVPNRVDLAVFSPPKRSYEIAGPAVRVVTVGNYVPVKNHLKLIEDLLKSIPNAELTIIGRGPLMAEYESFALQLGVTDRMNLVFAETHEKLAMLLMAQDIYVHYSLSEGIARAILEAMAIGLPVICTPVGYINGVLTNEHDVLLLGSQGAETLNESMARLLQNTTVRERLGRAARKTVEDKHEWGQVFDSYRSAILECQNR